MTCRPPLYTSSVVRCTKILFTPGLTSLARHCLCSPGARGIYVPRHRRSSCAVVVVLLFIVGGVQPNPGSTAHGNNNGSINLGCLNVLSAVNKSAEIHSIIADHKLNLIAVTVTWITSDALPVIKSDIAPSDYAVLHIHFKSEQSGPTRGGGLIVIHRDSLVVRNYELHEQSQSTSFELQLVHK